MTNYDLEERLIEFAVQIIKFTDNMPNSRSGNHMASQLLRSGTSPALNYGEAQSSESRRDFIHKIKIILKELRETYINLKIILRSRIYKNQSDIEVLVTECNELISIFVSSVKTAEKKL